MNASKVIPVTFHTGQETGTLQVTHQEFCLTSLKIYCYHLYSFLKSAPVREKVLWQEHNAVINSVQGLSSNTDPYSRFKHVLMAIHRHFSFLSNESVA